MTNFADMGLIIRTFPVLENIFCFFGINSSLLKKSGVGCRGTFEIVPLLIFNHKFLVFFKNICLFPVILSILKNKNKITHEELFKLIKLIINGVEPKMNDSDIFQALGS